MASSLGRIALRRWRIRSLDPEVQIEIEGPFQPDNGVQDDRQPVMATGTTAGSAIPHTQWVSEGSRVERFSSLLRSRHLGDDIRPDIRAVKSLVRRNSILGRAPRIAFTWGDDEIRGFVSSLRPRIAGLWPGTNFPRLFPFDIEITESAAPEPFGIAAPGETQFVRLKAGETFEGLGLRYAGNPLRGELIRRYNPQVEQDGPQTGARVRIFEADHPEMQGEVVPTSIPFQDRLQARDVWHPVVDTLGASRGSATDPGLPWGLLPEVIAGEIDTDYGDG